MSQTLCSAKLRALSQSRIIKSSHGCEENFSPEEAILLGVALNKHFSSAYSGEARTRVDIVLRKLPLSGGAACWSEVVWGVGCD
jgi:hypothetical protein